MNKTDEFERQGILWIYDIGEDDIRAATQKDITALQIAANAYGQMKSLCNTVTETAELIRLWERSNNPMSPEFKDEVQITSFVQ